MTPPMSGFEEEIFDVTPYGDAITSFILDNQIIWVFQENTK